MLGREDHDLALREAAGREIADDPSRHLRVSVLGPPLTGEAQQPGKVYRLGILSPGGVPDPLVATTPNLVPMALREIGYVLMSPTLTRDRKQIIGRAATYRLPAIYEWREQVEVGGLMSYGGSIVELSRLVAVYVDKILKGSKPTDLPVEQPTEFELVISLKAARRSA